MMHLCRIDKPKRCVHLFDELIRSNDGAGVAIYSSFQQDIENENFKDIVLHSLYHINLNSFSIFLLHILQEVLTQNTCLALNFLIRYFCFLKHVSRIEN